MPFNEYFDTAVDDKIIAYHSLNGMFIDKHIYPSNLSTLPIFGAWILRIRWTATLGRSRFFSADLDRTTAQAQRRNSRPCRYA
ncbi:MAG: DUF6430 domain-containing protein [Clostridium sp.]|nr:DUF6430 domain-containing protein [Clostridium sp.]